MLRQVDLGEISDGKIYHSKDIVNANCNGCKGCYACCTGMGKSITLDPFDIFTLTRNLNKSFEELIAELIELSVSDGVILPNLKMTGANENCSFLDEEGRCRIHSFRPGLCRLFPLGRYFEDNLVHYILQVHECKDTNRTDIRVDEWIGLAVITSYEQFLTDWHYFMKKVKELVSAYSEQAKAVNMYLLKIFYLNPYNNIDFFEQFNERLSIARKALFNA